MNKRINLYVCKGFTDKYEDTFSKVLDKFVKEFEGRGIIEKCEVFTQAEIEEAFDDHKNGKAARVLGESQLLLFITEEQGMEIEHRMKNFLQKVSIWCYTMPMLGKLGILVSVCNENELLITTNYMTKLLLSWGSGVVGRLVLQNGKDNDIELDRQIHSIANKVIKACNDASFEVSDSQMDNFSINQKVIKELDDTDGLKRYWKKNKYLEATDFQELFDSRLFGRSV